MAASSFMLIKLELTFDFMLNSNFSTMDIFLGLSGTLRHTYLTPYKAATIVLTQLKPKFFRTNPNSPTLIFAKSCLRS
jgi:hypothetical protein